MFASTYRSGGKGAFAFRISRQTARAGRDLLAGRRLSAQSGQPFWI